MLFRMRVNKHRTRCKRPFHILPLYNSSQIQIPLSLLLILIYGCLLQAQGQTSKTLDNQGNRLILKTSPLAYTNFFTQNIFAFNLGLEYGINEKMAIYLESSLPSNSLKFIRPEFRVYFAENTGSRKYISLEYIYMEQHFSYKDSIGDNFMYQKKYSMSKYLNIINIKYGWHKNISQNFSLDYFAGLGIRHRNGIIKGLTKDEIFYREIGSGERSSFLKEGKYFVPNITLGIRICYAIR